MLVHITPAGEKIVATRHADRVARLAPIIELPTPDQRPALDRIAESGRQPDA